METTIMKRGHIKQMRALADLGRREELGQCFAVNIAYAGSYPNVEKFRDGI